MADDNFYYTENVNKKICINKKIFFVICLILLFSVSFYLINNVINKKTSYKSEAATSKKNVVKKPAAIYGGTEVTDPKKWPFIVRFYHDFQHDFCDGTLIAPSWVLTASHCEVKVTDTVFVGSNDLNANIKRMTIKNVYYPPYYDYYVNDIMLVELANDVKNVETISLNVIPDYNLEREGAMAVLIGWGRIEGNIMTNILRQAVLPVLSNERVNQIDWYKDSYISDVYPSNIALGYPLGGSGQCSGDSGGPGLVWNGKKWIQISIISWSEKPCGSPKKPGIGTRISYFGTYESQLRGDLPIFNIWWIRNTINNQKTYDSINYKYYNGQGTFIGKELTTEEKKEFIQRIWINRELGSPPAHEPQ